jgi:soluble lytic murein transglycosylase-like protein
MQPATARRYGVKNIYDPEQNVRAGAHYLNDLLTRFGSNLELAPAAYNAGEDAVERYRRHVPPYRKTLAYLPSVMKVYRRLRIKRTQARGESALIAANADSRKR